MTKLTTTLLTDETIKNVMSFGSEELVSFCNTEEAVYSRAMTIAKCDFARRGQLIEAFNSSVISFAMNYCN